MRAAAGRLSTDFCTPPVDNLLRARPRLDWKNESSVEPYSWHQGWVSDQSGSLAGSRRGFAAPTDADHQGPQAA